MKEFVCPPEHKHAESATCYVQHRCRCAECRARNAYRVRRRTRLKAYGRYDTGLVDAGPAREHLLALREYGMGYKMIARAAGVGTTVTRTLLYGREDYQNGVHGPRHGEVKKRISRANAEAILAVRPDVSLLGERVTVPARATVRRLQALVALGWSQSKLAELAGMTPGSVNRMLRSYEVGRQAGRAYMVHVRASTAVVVRALYEELSNTLPPREVWRDRIAFSRSRRYAAERGWPLPMDWEAYDNNFDRVQSVRRSAA